MSIKKLKSGKWQARFSWYDSNKKRKMRAKSFNRKSDAISWEADMQKRKDNDMMPHQADLSFSEYFWKWFETYKEASVTERTRKTYVSAYHALLNYLPPISAGNMNRRYYRQFIANYGKNHSKATVSKFNSLYHACVKDGIYDGDIKKDFIRATDIVFNKKKTRRIEYLSIADMRKITGYLLNSLNPHFTSKYMILFALFTGARLGEVQGLKWKDINFTFHTITIKRSWNATTHEFKDTKNESSKRILRVNQKLLDILQKLKETTNPGDEDQVFLNQYHTVPTSGAVNRKLKAVMKELGIERKGFHFHSLRHTHVAYLLANNVDLYIISKRLGHADITTTSRVYSYLIDEYRIKADDQIEEILDQISPQQAPDTSDVKSS